MTQHQMSTQQSESRLQKVIKGFGIGNILTVVIIAISGIGYFNNKFDKQSQDINNIRIENATILANQKATNDNVIDLKRHQEEHTRQLADHALLFDKLLTINSKR